MRSSWRIVSAHHAAPRCRPRPGGGGTAFRREATVLEEAGHQPVSLRTHRALAPWSVSYHILPFILVAAFLLIAGLPKNAPVLSVLAFALAGFGCSALLPLTISLGQEKLAAMSNAVAGGVVAFYQIGYALAAFGVGPLHDAGVVLPAIFAASAVVAASMGVLSFIVARRRPSPASLHPRLASPGDASRPVLGGCTAPCTTINTPSRPIVGEWLSAPVVTGGLTRR
jgi:MFS family permease